jgi:hypothetical protein
LPKRKEKEQKQKKRYHTSELVMRKSPSDSVPSFLELFRVPCLEGGSILLDLGAVPWNIKFNN